MTLAQLLAPTSSDPAVAPARRRPGRPRVADDPAERLKHLGAAAAVIIHGRPIWDVARQFDVCPKTIRNWMRLAQGYECPSAELLRRLAPLASAN